MDFPEPLPAALDSMEGDALATIAAFLLLAGVWHRAEFRRNPLVPVDQLETGGFNSWSQSPSGSRGKIKTRDLSDGRDEWPPAQQYIDGVSTPDRRQANDRLRSAIMRGVRSGERLDAARAIYEAFFSPVSLLRTSAYISALDALALNEKEVEYLRFDTQRSLLAIRPEFPESGSESLSPSISPLRWLEAELTELLAGKLGAATYRYERGLNDAQHVVIPQPSLMLIHGTVLWGRPEWSVPGSGKLFNYIQSTLRPDVYSAPDYFVWEGSYNIGGYGREVAAQSLVNWVQSRRLLGIDAVAHSHGGNVLLLGTGLGCQFGDVLLLSCPVRKQYKLNKHNVQHTRSVRISFDLVLVADRARQRFPRNSGIHETVLPIWYCSHNATINPATWLKHRIRI